MPFPYAWVFVVYKYSVGRPKHVKVMAGGLEGDIFIGPKAEVRTSDECIGCYQKKDKMGCSQ